MTSHRTADIANATIDLGELALALGLTDRSSLHADGTTPESVTDHTVMLTLAACALADRYAPHLDQGLIAIRASVHDVVEVYAKDTSTLQLLSTQALVAKAARERAAFERIANQFGMMMPWLGRHIEAYEAQSDPESRWVKTCDKIIVKVTHILNGCAAPLRDGMTFAELANRYIVQGEELFGKGGYAADFPDLAEIYYELVNRELDIFATRILSPAPDTSDADALHTGLLASVDGTHLNLTQQALRAAVAVTLKTHHPIPCNWPHGCKTPDTHRVCAECGPAVNYPCPTIDGIISELGAVGA